MHGFYIERRKIPTGSNLSTDLAQHIFLRSAKGLVVVITSKPHDLASITKKQWNDLIRKVERERSSTLKAARIAELTIQTAWMRRLKFIIGRTELEFPDSGVIFVQSSEVLDRPPICSTIYIIEKMSKEQFHKITSWLQANCIVIVYEESLMG